MTALTKDQANSTAGLPSSKTMGRMRREALMDCDDEDGDCLSVTLELRVWDAKAFRFAARDRALVDGLSADEAAAFLDPERQTLGDCARMLFDPGVGPNGCEVLGSSAG